MDLEHIKKSIQPELDQDFDALFEEFVTDTGSDDVVGFLKHLLDFGLVGEGVINPLLAPRLEAPIDGVKPIVWDDDDGSDEEDATVLARTADLITLSQVAATSSPSLPSFEPGEADGTAQTLIPDRSAPVPAPDEYEPPPATPGEPDVPEPPPYEDAPPRVGPPAPN
ncbi:MAG: hypothetical protein KC656_08965, partial [Myxococcales bacterium]|nr:hypothetical protein [Myxococcales bacterium]